MQWSNIEEIAEALEDSNPDEEIDKIRFNKLHNLVISLLDFDDDHRRASDQVLEAIQEAWLELRDNY